jgi:hypothetical protein
VELGMFLTAVGKAVLASGYWQAWGIATFGLAEPRTVKYLQDPGLRMLV